MKKLSSFCLFVFPPPSSQGLWISCPLHGRVQHESSGQAKTPGKVVERPGDSAPVRAAEGILRLLLNPRPPEVTPCHPTTRSALHLHSKPSSNLLTFVLVVAWRLTGAIHRETYKQTRFVRLHVSLLHVGYLLKTSLHFFFFFGGGEAGGIFILQTF